jgi:hypothetical protein
MLEIPQRSAAKVDDSLERCAIGTAAMLALNAWGALVDTSTVAAKLPNTETIDFCPVAGRQAVADGHRSC